MLTPLAIWCVELALDLVEADAERSDANATRAGRMCLAPVSALRASIGQREGHPGRTLVC